MSHMSPFSLVVPVFPIQSALAKLGLIAARLFANVVVARDEITSRNKLCMIVAVALEYT